MKDQQPSKTLSDAERCCERGSGRRCYRRAIGAIGMMRYCGPCFASLVGWRGNDKRLHQVARVSLYDGTRKVGETLWIPANHQATSQDQA